MCAGTQPGERAHPGAEFRWDADGERLLAQAKEHLAALTAFGIADCFRTSLLAVAPALGWDAAAALAKLDRDGSRGSRTNKRKRGGTWAESYPADLVKEVVAANSVDMALYDYALQLLAKRAGEPQLHTSRLPALLPALLTKAGSRLGSAKKPSTLLFLRLVFSSIKADFCKSILVINL